MKYINIKNILFVLFIIAFASCGDDDEVEEWKTDFQLSANSINFTNAAGKNSITISDVTEVPQAKIISKNADWCSIKMEQGAANSAILNVNVEENIKVSNRTAQVELLYQGRKKQIMILQAKKIFDHIAGVTNLKATPKIGAVELTWKDPVEDNVKYVVVSVNDKDNLTVHTEKVEIGVQKLLISNLLSSNGNYDFEIQSFDMDNEPGKIANIKCKALKRVAFKFKDIPAPRYLEYYFKKSDIYTSHIKIGSNEFEENEKITVKFEVAPELLEQYNAENSKKAELLPAEAYTPSEVVYNGTSDYQDLEIPINTTFLKDRHRYALPLKIVDAGDKEIEEVGSTAILLFHVDDLEGWYNVERLPKCGESADKYVDVWRRYLKRTGEYTWETGYLFNCYYYGESSEGYASNTIQFITLDPETKKLHIQQNGYATAEDLNEYDPDKQELHIEYLFQAWAGWWTHERMYNRGFECGRDQ